MIGLDEWWAGGEHLPEGAFTRAGGDLDAPAVTWLHGFPMSSWDWAKLHAALGPGRRDVSLDFLGFGASEKPRRHRRLTEPDDPQRGVSPTEFDEMVRDLHTEAPSTATAERDPTADASPEDLVLKDDKAKRDKPKRPRNKRHGRSR